MRKDYTSLEPFEVRCQWWKPDMPDNCVSGIAGFDGGKIVIRMDEWVDARHPFQFPQADTLHGETIDGVHITAYETAVTQTKESQIHLIANAMAVGEHLKSNDEQLFSDAVLQLTGMDSWWRVNRFSTDRDDQGTLTVECPLPSSISIDLPEGSGEIAVGESRSEQHGGRSFEITYSPQIHLQPSEPQSISWFYSIINDLRQLFDLFCGQNLPLCRLSVKPKLREPTLYRVEWYLNLPAKNAKGMNESCILLPFDCVKDDLQNIVTNWLAGTADFKDPRALLFSSQARPAPFMETRFLPIVQALEVYCRCLKKERYLPKSEFKVIQNQMYDLIPDHWPESLIQKLKASIGFANELSLGDRILLLLLSLSEGIRNFICQDPEFFSRLLRDTRNHFTHYGGSGKILEGLALHWGTEQAALLLRLLMLKDGCDIPESLIEERLNKSWHHQQGMQIWADIEKDLCSDSED